MIRLFPHFVRMNNKQDLNAYLIYRNILTVFDLYHLTHIIFHVFAIPSAARQEYLDNLHWLKPGYDGVSYLTPFDIVGDFVYNFNEFGQIVISNFADALNGVKSVEEAMAVAQTQAEALAERIS